MSRNSVNQQITCFSVPREAFLERVVNNDELDKKQLRVVLMLLTELEGWPESLEKSKPMQLLEHSE